VQHVTVFPHAFEVAHVDPTTSVKGLTGLALHLIRRRHCFDGRARRPLPLALAAPAGPAPRIRSMQLAFAPGASGAALVALGLGTPSAEEGCAPPRPGVVRVQAGVEKFTAFYMFNANLVSRLSAHFAGRSLQYARGVCANMALGATMQATDPGSVVRAETLTAAAVSASTLKALRALRTGRPCSTVCWLGAGGESRHRHSVYDAQSLDMGFVMFARGGTPVVVGLPLAPAPAAAAAPAPAPAPAADADSAPDDDLVEGVCDAYIWFGPESAFGAADFPPLVASAPAVCTAAAGAPAVEAAAVEAAAASAPAPPAAPPGGGPQREKAAPPAKAPQPAPAVKALSTAPGDVHAAAACADMLFLHAASAEGPLAPHARTLKAACYERHAASLDSAPRAVLAALRDENSPGVFALAAELVFVG